MRRQKEIVGPRIRGYMDAVGIQQKAVAIEAGMGEDVVSRILTGSREPQPMQLFLLGVAVGKIRNRDQRAQSKPAA